MPRAPGRKITHARMEDVARRAKVSAITVSRALRSPEKVSRETRERVQEAIAAIGYVQNSVAGSLASRRTNILAAIIPSISHAALENMVQGLSDGARENGLHLILGTSGDTLEGEQEAIAAILAQRPCGLCLHNTVHTAQAHRLLAGAGIPVVETGDLIAEPVEATVGFSNFAAAKAMTVHLGERDYRRIAFAGLPVASSVRSGQRQRGYFAGLRALGRARDAELVMQVPSWTQGGGSALAELLQARPDIDAVFFSAGALAIGALLECHRRGWPVPGRVAIAGFDDNDIASQVTPRLTTVRVPRYDIGRKAAEYVVARLGGATPPTRLDVGFEIIQRESA